MAAWTQADIDKLRQAITDGGVLKSMTFADQEFVFRDLDEMLKLLSVMEGAVGTNQKTRYAATSKGV